MILRVGLTGGIATGKSTVARTLAALGCAVVDADALVTRLYRPGAAGHDALVDVYGVDILRMDGEIDRQKLSSIAFATPEDAKKLNALIHPLVIAEQQRLMDAEDARFPGRDRIFVVEATLLLESGGRERFDRIVVVDVDPETQVARAVARGMAEAEARRRMANQLPREQRLALADYVVDNRGDLRQLEVETHRLFEKLKADCAAKRR